MDQKRPTDQDWRQDSLVLFVALEDLGYDGQSRIARVEEVYEVTCAKTESGSADSMSDMGGKVTHQLRNLLPCSERSPEKSFARLVSDYSTWLLSVYSGPLLSRMAPVVSIQVRKGLKPDL